MDRMYLPRSEIAQESRDGPRTVAHNKPSLARMHDEARTIDQTPLELGTTRHRNLSEIGNGKNPVITANANA